MEIVIIALLNILFVTIIIGVYRMRECQRNYLTLKARLFFRSRNADANSICIL